MYPANIREDEQYAKDLELAYKLFDREERRAQRRRLGESDHEQCEIGDGFRQGAVNADHLLFVNGVLDRRKVPMMVDTGASASTMSMKMVTLLGLEQKMNRSINGSARGVGSSSILGIVEHVNCTIGLHEFRSFFLVLEGSMSYCILGIDQMRRFKCVIDVGENTLTFGGRDSRISVPFLSKEDAAMVACNMMSEDNDAARAKPVETAREEQSQEAEQTEEVRRKNGGLRPFSLWSRKKVGRR